MNINDVIDKTLFSLEDISEYEDVGVYNMHDISVDEDESFVLSNGIVSHNSALGFGLSVRDPKKHGFFPLRGVILNTWDLTPSEVLKNKELSEVIAILGLNINDPNSVRDMTYREIATLTDADHDGNRIATMLMAFFYKYWPKLFEEKRVSITRTPVMVSEKGKDTKWCYTYEDAEKWKQENPSWHHRMIKGLGLLREDEYSEIINNPSMYRITVDDAKLFQVMFGDDAKPRKEFMMQ